MSDFQSGNKNIPDPNSSTLLGESSHSSDINSDVRALVYGYVSMMGRRRTMEDAITVAPPGWLVGEYSFFAAYDGHGGNIFAEKCTDKMHHCLQMHMDKAKEQPETNFDWEKVMVECFLSMDEELKKDNTEDEVMNSASAIGTIGSTAVVVLVGKNEVVVANCGDSRVVLCQDGVAMPLSKDHKPEREDEKERIEAAGGTVTSTNGWRVEGVLAISRSLGDASLKPYVISEPEVTVLRRSKSHDFLIIATDGLFDVVSNEIACEVVRECLGDYGRQDGASMAATILAQFAIAKGSKDNISVIVVQMA